MRIAIETNEKNRPLLYSILSALIMGLFIFLVYYFNTPNPNMILITALVFFTGIGGTLPGAVAAILMMVYSMFFFSTDHSFIHFTEINVQKITIIFIGIVLNFFCVGLLKRSRDQSNQKLSKANRELLDQNALLAREAQDAAKIAELTESVSSLLQNMPALTFSKDVTNGKYLACNQMFAEYANKEDPSKVVGLTDYEIFDEKTAEHFVQDDQMAMNMEKPYVFYEDVPDAVGNPRQFQTTKLKFTDTAGRTCTLGMCVDVTEMMRVKRENLQTRKAYEKVQSENLTYSHIARALSADYSRLYYVDLDTDQFVEYHSDNSLEELAIERRGEDFFQSVQADMLQHIFPEDQDGLVKAFTKENVLHKLEEQGIYMFTYRRLIENEPVYYNMKVTRMQEDDRHIIIGINNVDTQIRQKEALERVKEERITYARVTALSGDYLCIYTVDPNTGHYLEYSATNDYAIFGVPKEGEDFFQQSRNEGLKVLYYEDISLFLTEVTRENLLKEIKNNGLFVLDYRLMINGTPVYVSMKAVLVEEKDGPQLIIGVSNIDARVKKEQEYANNLSEARNRANLDALTGVKNKHAYVDMESQLNHQIEEKLLVEFAMVVFDVNGLKKVNDTQGHQTGDHYIKQSCKIICNIFKRSPVFRVGGDEFAVIAQGEDYDNIEKLMEMMEQSNRENIISGGIVIACGMAKYHWDRSVSAVFERADSRMYDNKKRLKSV